jgi:hypothetical protein
MHRIKPDVDIVMDVLNTVLAVRPDAVFVQSLLQQYRERGGLSKKQLQGLYDKARKTGAVPDGKLATLEAIILKKHTKHRSELPANAPLFQKDENTEKLLTEILAGYPQHKGVLFLKAKFDKDIPFSTAEMAELQKFHKLLVQKDKGKAG